MARRPAFPSVVFGLTGEFAVPRIERPPNVVANYAAYCCAGERGDDLPATLTKLVADNAAGDRSDGGTAFFVVSAASYKLRGDF